MATQANPQWESQQRRGEITPASLTNCDTTVPAYIATGGAGGPTLAVLGAVHGDEYEGPLAIAELLHALPLAAMRGTLVAVPIVNGPAYAAGQRADPADGKDLARCFPGDPDGTPTEQLAHLIAQQCIAPADALIDLHSGGVALEGALLVGYTATADEAGERSRALAHAFGAPVVWEHPPPMPPGRTGSFALARGIPFIYTEGPGGGGAERATLDCFRDGVLRVMTALGMLPGATPAPRHRERWRGGGNTDTMVAARGDGIFRAHVRTGQQIAAGRLVGEILDSQGTVIERLVASRSGVLAFVRRIPRVRAGDGLYMLTERVE